MTEQFYFQEFSRRNDAITGEPYRLILVYRQDGRIWQAVESRSSSSNFISNMWQAENYHPLPTFSLSNAEYKQAKEAGNVARILVKNVD